MVVTFKEENLLTFKHLFLKNYADGDAESYAVYRQADVYDYISYAINQVNEHHLTCNGRDFFSVLLAYCWKSLLDIYYRETASLITCSLSLDWTLCLSVRYVK